MSKSAKQIYEMIILASRDNSTLWPHDIIARDFRGAMGVGTQSHQFFHSGPDDDKRSVLMRTDPGSG